MNTLINNRYRLEQELGQGGMGTVYRSIDTLTSTPVAIKTLRTAEISSHPDLMQRFIREGEILRDLNHPNIVNLLDTFEEDGNHYLVMEYVEGGDLTGLIEAEEPAGIPEILSIAIELADALTRAHHLNILHRDIKPANVLLAEGGTVRLTDFGIASLHSPRDSPKKVHS